jgi:hypothetical protein
MPEIVRCREPGCTFELECDPLRELPNPLLVAAGCAQMRGAFSNPLMGSPSGCPAFDKAFQQARAMALRRMGNT